MNKQIEKFVEEEYYAFLEGKLLKNYSWQNHFKEFEKNIKQFLNQKLKEQAEGFIKEIEKNYLVEDTFFKEPFVFLSDIKKLIKKKI